MSRSNFPREDEHSKYSRMRTKTINHIMQAFEITDSYIREAIKIKLGDAFHAGWMACGNRTLAMLEGKPAEDPSYDEDLTELLTKSIEEANDIADTGTDERDNSDTHSEGSESITDDGSNDMHTS